MIGGWVGLVLGLATAPLVSEVSVDQVEIRYSFDGADLLVFGAVDLSEDSRARPDVVVAITGPPIPTVIRKKERVAGIWINTQSVRFSDAPGFFHVVSTRPVDAIAAEMVLAQAGLLIENWAFTSDAAPAVQADFTEALLRRKRLAGLYNRDPDGVTIKSNRLFRTDLRLPANVPTGPYEVHVLAFLDGEIIGQQRQYLDVTKEGFERTLYTLANERPLAYGLLAVIIALGAGWLAAAATNRKRL